MGGRINNERVRVELNNVQVQLELNNMVYKYSEESSLIGDSRKYFCQSIWNF
jgi:hypothetical protein